MTENRKLLFLGFGNVACHVNRQADSYGIKYTTTRSNGRVKELCSQALEVFLLEEDLTNCDLGPLARASRQADVLVTFPPDSVADKLLSGAISEPRKVVYISSTGVFGNKSGVIDDFTEPDYDCKTASSRIEAENIWSSLGNTVVLRTPALYGRDYGLHKSLAAGKFKLPGDGSRFTSRIHLYDLARIILRVFERDIEYGAYNVGDRKPCTQIEVVNWLCDQMKVDVPESKPMTEVHHTLSADRQIDSSRLLDLLEIELAYPTYVEGFQSCLSEVV